MAMTPRALGALALGATLAADQANKLWLIFVYRDRGAPAGPARAFFRRDLSPRTPAFPIRSCRAQNGTAALRPSSRSLSPRRRFWAFGSGGRERKSSGLGLGLIVGGALGNAYDRLAYGFVADFYHFHIGSFSWYVFNLADVAIVAGVTLLIFDFLETGKKDARRRERRQAIIFC